MRQLQEGQKEVPHIVTVPNCIMKNGTFLYATINMDHIVVTPLFMFITFIPYPLPGILTAVLNTEPILDSVLYFFVLVFSCLMLSFSMLNVPVL
jgi:hypothetical protein